MEILEFTFFQNAILILLLTSIVSGIVGSLIVIKKISMITGSIAHGAFGGLGAAYYFGLAPLSGALVFSSIGAVLIGLVYRKFRDNLDSMLTIFWAGGMAVGLIFVFITPGYATDLFSYLFGNVLLNRSSEIFLIGIITSFVVLTTVLLYHTLIAVLFDEEFARLKRIPVTIVFIIFLLLVSTSVVALIKSTGIILTLAMFTISPAISIKYFKKVGDIMIFSIILNIATSISGLFLSYYMDIPTAPSIILLQILLFSLSIIFRKSLKT